MISSTLTLATMCRGIADGLVNAITGSVIQNYNEMTEAALDVPLLQVYPNSTAVRNATGQNTLRGGVRVTDVEIYVDVLVTERSFLAEDMEAVVDAADDIMAVLNAEKTYPPFTVVSIQALSWRMDRVQFAYGGMNFVGLRFTLSGVVY